MAVQRQGRPRLILQLVCLRVPGASGWHTAAEGPMSAAMARVVRPTQTDHASAACRAGEAPTGPEALTRPITNSFKLRSAGGGSSLTVPQGRQSADGGSVSGHAANLSGIVRPSRPGAGPCASLGSCARTGAQSPACCFAPASCGLAPLGASAAHKESFVLTLATLWPTLPCGSACTSFQAPMPQVPLKASAQQAPGTLHGRAGLA